MGFRNPIASLSGLLNFPAIYSQGFVSGISGWIIRRNGTAEFNSLGGSFQINNAGIFFYIPTAASGNLIASFSNADGTDSYGNAYIGGFFLNQRRAHFTNNSDTVEINPTGATGPEIDWIPGGFNTMFSIIGDIALDLIRFVPSTILSGHPNLIMQMEGPVRVTGALTATSTLDVTDTITGGNIVSGTTSITPVANTPTSKVITFPTPLTGSNFACLVTANTTVPGTAVLGVGYTSLSNTGVTLFITRTNTTATTLSYLVWGS